MASIATTIQSGGRISSAKLRHSLEQSELFEGLEEDTNKYDLLFLVKRLGKSAGFTPRMISLLDYYINFTRDIDWEEGGQPIVYQSLTNTAFDQGVTERQIQNLEKALFEVGAITWNDSGNHRRYGQRCKDTGMILYAYGVNLAPLAAMKTALEEKLIEKQMYEDAWKETKRQISWHRRQIRAVLGELEEQGTAQYRAISESYDLISGSIRTNLNLSALRELLAKHKELYSKAMDLDEIKTKISIKSTSTDVKNFVHYNNTTYKKSNKLDTCKANAQSFQKSSKENLDDEKRRDVQMGQSEQLKADDLILKTGLQHITLKQALNASSERFRERLPLDPRPMNWNDFIEAAYKIKSELDISQQSWAKACVALGRSGAAICVLLVDQATQRKENRVYKPAAYFNSMINRSGAGELQLHKSIFGLLQSEG